MKLYFILFMLLPSAALAADGSSIDVHVYINTVIALIALGLAIYEGWSNRKHNKLSVKPKIDAAISFLFKDGEFIFSIINNGLGPAIITSVKIFVGTDEVDSNLSLNNRFKKAIQLVAPGLMGHGRLSSIDIGFSITANREHKFADLACDFQNYVIKSKTTEAELKNNLDKITYHIEYESIYGEKFFLDSSNSGW